MKRIYLFLLIAVLLFACGCSSNKSTGGEGSTQAQVSSEDSSKMPESSHTDPNSPEESTTSSLPEQSAAGISPTTDVRSDAESGKTSGSSSQGTTEGSKAPETATPDGNQTSSEQIRVTKPPESSVPPTSSATRPPSDPPESQPSEPSASNPPDTTSQPDTEAEYARIIQETVAYANSYTAKGFTFIWDDSLEFSWESGAGWMGTPRVKYEGVDGTIEMLKYHIDKIVKTSTDPGNGIPSHSANYKVMQVTVDGDIAFVVLYG